VLRRIASPKPIGALLALGFASMLSAQLNSAQQSVTLTAQAAESISIVMNAGATLNFTIPGINSQTMGSVVPSFTTSWVLAASRTSVKVYMWSFSGLTGQSTGTNIPNTSFTGQANGGSFMPFSTQAVQGAGTTGAGIVVSTTTIGSGNLTSSKTDSVALNLLGPCCGPSVTPYPTDVYNGTLTILAQATP
jgi:hypothetical protein